MIMLKLLQDPDLSERRLTNLNNLKDISLAKQSICHTYIFIIITILEFLNCYVCAICLILCLIDDTICSKVN